MKVVKVWLACLSNLCEFCLPTKNNRQRKKKKMKTQNHFLVIGKMFFVYFSFSFLHLMFICQSHQQKKSLQKHLLIVFSFRHRESLFECLSFFCLCDRFKMADVKLLLTLFCAADCILLGMFIIASIFMSRIFFIVMHIHWPELSIPAN